MLSATRIAISGSSQSQPVSADQADAYDHADGGVHIGAQMLAVGFQRDGMVHFGRFEQYPNHGGIDGRAAYGKQQPPADFAPGVADEAGD